mgnify:CR=1 FL=1
MSLFSKKNEANCHTTFFPSFQQQHLQNDPFVLFSWNEMRENSVIYNID